MATRDKKTDSQIIQDKTDYIMNIIAERCAYYRANPQRFCSEFLGIKLKLFQKIIIWIMMHYDAFYFVATRGIGHLNTLISASYIFYNIRSLSMSKYFYNKDYFSKIDSSDKAYWLGFLYADGCINRYYKNDKLKSMTLEISLSEKDKHHLEKFNQCLESNVPIHNRKSNIGDKKYDSVRLNICCTKMCYDLINLKCTPQKTFTIRFPDENIVPKEYIRDWLRGFFDGDGCISTTMMSGSPHITIVITGIEEMLKDISSFLLSENILRKKPLLVNDNRSKAYALRIYGTDTIKEFLDYIYKDATIYLDRKYQKYIDFYKDYKEIQKRGVHWSKENKAYVVTITINGKRIRVGQSKNLQEAINMRKEAEIKKSITKNSQLNQ